MDDVAYPEALGTDLNRLRTRWGGLVILGSGYEVGDPILLLQRDVLMTLEGCGYFEFVNARADNSIVMLDEIDVISPAQARLWSKATDQYIAVITLTPSPKAGWGANVSRDERERMMPTLLLIRALCEVAGREERPVTFDL